VSCRYWYSWGAKALAGPIAKEKWEIADIYIHHISPRNGVVHYQAWMFTLSDSKEKVWRDITTYRANFRRQTPIVHPLDPTRYLIFQSVNHSPNFVSLPMYKTYSKMAVVATTSPAGQGQGEDIEQVSDEGDEGDLEYADEEDLAEGSGHTG